MYIYHGYTDPIDFFLKGGGCCVTYFAGPVAGRSGDTPAGWGNSGG